MMDRLKSLYYQLQSKYWMMRYGKIVYLPIKSVEVDIKNTFIRWTGVIDFTEQVSADTFQFYNNIDEIPVESLRRKIKRPIHFVSGDTLELTLVQELTCKNVTKTKTGYIFTGAKK